MAQPPYLTDDEIAAICMPLVNGAARYRYLTKLGMHAGRKPNGQPLVARSEFERVMGAARMGRVSEMSTVLGDMTSLRERWRGRNGAQTQRR